MRIWQTGAEWQNPIEYGDQSGNGHITTDTAKTFGSSASYKISANDTSWTQKYGYHAIPSSNKLFYKADMNISALTASTSTNLVRINPITLIASVYIVEVMIFYRDGKFTCYAEYSNGSSESQYVDLDINFDEWFRFECMLDSTSASGVFELRINGETVISTTDPLLGSRSVSHVWNGVNANYNGSLRTATLNIDNIAVNDDDGSVNNSWVGEEYIVMALPDGAGDSNPSAGTYASINEVPATTTASSPANRIEINNTSDYGWFALDTAGLDGTEHEINAISVPALLREDVFGTSSYNIGIKSASGGREYYANDLYYPDLSYSAIGGMDAGNAVVRLSPDGITSGRALLISNTDPTTNSKWKVSGPNSLANAQIGVRKVSGAPNIWVTGMVAMVAYTPKESIETHGMLIMFW